MPEDQPPPSLFRPLTPKEKEAELSEHLVFRMRALSVCELICKLMGKYGQEVPFTFRFGHAPDLGELGRSLSSRIFTNPVVDSAIIHSRVLFFFLGLKVNRKGDALIDREKVDDELVIEQFGQARLTLAQFQQDTNGHPEAVDSVRQILAAANKSVAHHADNDLERTGIRHLYRTCQIALFYMKRFYERAGREPVELFDVADVMAQFAAIEAKQKPPQ